MTFERKAFFSIFFQQWVTLFGVCQYSVLFYFHRLTINLFKANWEFLNLIKSHYKPKVINCIQKLWKLLNTLYYSYVSGFFCCNYAGDSLYCNYAVRSFYSTFAGEISCSEYVSDNFYCNYAGWSFCYSHAGGFFCSVLVTWLFLS